MWLYFVCTFIEKHVCMGSCFALRKAWV